MTISQWTGKLTEAQRRLLNDLTPEFTRFHERRGIPQMLGNPTVHALIDRKLIEVDTVPPRWRITETGRAALHTAGDRK